MTFAFLTEDVKISLRRLVAVTILFSNNLVYFYLFFGYLLDQMFVDFESTIWIYVGNLFFFTSIVFSAVIGSLISEKVSRRKLLWAWLAFGLVTTASLALLGGLEFSLISSVLIGVSFGLGYPSCVAFLADSTEVEERGRVSGVVVLVTFVVLFLAIFSSSFLNLGFVELIYLCLILKATSFFALFLDPCERKVSKKESWRNIFTSKDFGAYFFPWLMFSVAYGLSLIVGAGLPDTSGFKSAFAMGRVLQYVSSGLFAFIAGVLADYLGRKQPIIIGLIILGGSYAFVGLATSPLSWIIFLISSGVAWGMLMVSLALTAFGDLSSHGSKERVFVIATIIPLMAHVSFSSVTEVFSLYAPANILSTVLSIILFVSVLPILRASETLPENKLRARRMKKYFRKLQEVVKESKKTG